MKRTARGRATAWAHLECGCRSRLSLNPRIGSRQPTRSHEWCDWPALQCASSATLGVRPPVPAVRVMDGVVPPTGAPV